MVLSSNQEFYISTATEDGLEKYNASLASYYPYQDGSTYARPGFSRYGYENQRPCESIPRNHRDIMVEAERVYCEVGLVRNIIDLITDFTLSGIRVVHSQPSIEKFYQNWFIRVSGVDRSERFCSNLYKFGNVIIRRRWAVLTKKQKKNIRRTKASDEVTLDNLKVPARRIPARYLFLNPSSVEMMGGELAKFVGPKVVRYGIKMPLFLNNKFNNKDAESQRILQEVPEEFKQLAGNGSDKFIPLDPDNTLVFHYKKEDWDVWAKPIVYGVFADIKTLEKLKLADLTALDGATDRIRLFTLGDLDNKIMPGPDAFAKLNELLQVNVGAGTRNLVWGPDIKLQETNTESWRFLGEEKYRPILSSIYAGLGIPPTLTGTNDAGGTTNNLVSLKALIKRLDYGRQKLVDFWTAEFELVRQAMGFQKAAVLEFDTNNLGDEEAEKKLFIELADRDIIPFEVVQKKFGLSPEVTSDKVENEWKERDKKNRVAKAGPFTNTFEQQLKKSLLDRGQVTPSEVGLELLPREKGDKTNLTPTQPQGGTQPAKPAKPNGRPIRQKDSVPRKQRRFTPVVKAEEFWAQAAQDKIAALLNPVLTQKFGKKNMRSLTAAETDEAEKIKFAAFFNSEIGSEISGQSIYASLQSPFPDVEYNTYKEVANDVAEKLGRDLTFAELHSIQIGVYLDGKI